MDPARKDKLGQRWTCHACGAKFYDLHRPDPHCPKCGTSQRENPKLVERPAPKRAKKKVVRPVEPEPPPPPPEEEEVEGAEAADTDLDFEELEMAEDEEESVAVEVEDDD